MKRVQGSLKTGTVVSDEEEMEMLESGRLVRQLMRQGGGYRICRDVSDPGKGVDGVFYAEAAKTAGVEIEMLLGAVRTVEDRIEKWRREKRRENMFGDGHFADIGDEPEGMDVEEDE